MSFFQLAKLAQLTEFIIKYKGNAQIEFTPKNSFVKIKYKTWSLLDIIGKTGDKLLFNLFKENKLNFSVEYKSRNNEYEWKKHIVIKTHRRFYEAYLFLLCMNRLNLFYPDIIKLIFFQIRGKLYKVMCCDECTFRTNLYSRMTELLLRSNKKLIICYNHNKCVLCHSTKTSYNGIHYCFRCDDKIISVKRGNRLIEYKTPMELEKFIEKTDLC